MTLEEEELELEEDDGDGFDSLPALAAVTARYWSEWEGRQRGPVLEGLARAWASTSEAGRPAGCDRPCRSTG